MMAVLILTLLGHAGGLNWAVKCGDLDAARAFLAVGADPNYRDSFLATPMRHVAMNDRAQMVVLLMDSGRTGTSPASVSRRFTVPVW